MNGETGNYERAPVSRFLARGLLAKRVAVDTAKDGQTGLQLAAGVQYNPIIPDLMLPRTGGTNILRRVRQINANVPVLVLAARDAPAS